MNHKVPTWATYVVAVVSIIAGYIWATLFPVAPYTVFAGSIVSVSGAYWAKRSSDAKREIDKQDCGKEKENVG